MRGKPKESPKPSFESEKLYYELFKHLTTLNTGVIVIIAALIDKIFKHPKFGWLLIIALPSFLISLVGSVFMMWVLATMVLGQEMGATMEMSRTPRLFGFILSAGFFLLAMICLLTLTITNLVWVSR